LLDNHLQDYYKLFIFVTDAAAK